MQNSDMPGIEPLIRGITDINLVVSTSSARILAEQFKPSVRDYILPLIISAGAAFAAIMSYFASKKSAQLSHYLFLNELFKEHDSLLRTMYDEFLPNYPLSNKNKQSMCNFLEKLCQLYYQKVISKKEISRYSSELFHKDFFEYAKKSKFLGSYKRWVSENGKIVG